MGKGHLGLPQIDRETFNRLSKQYYPEDAVCWVADKKEPGKINPDEIRLCEKTKGNLDDFAPGNSRPVFTSLFDRRYTRIVELRRQELVRKEVDRTIVETVTTDLSQYGLSPEDLQLIRHLLKAGEIMEDLYQMQLGSLQFRDQLLLGGTLTDRQMMERYQQPWCEMSSDPLCNALSTFTPKQASLYPEGMKQEEAKENLSTPFTVVVKENGKLKGIPFAQSFLGDKMREAAGEIRKAAKLARQVDEAPFANYLQKTADAMESDKLFPYVDSDKAWCDMKGKSKYYLRIGPDEVVSDAWQLKAGFHMTFGLIDPKAAESVQAYADIRQNMENAMAGVIGLPYRAREVDVSLPDFVNVIMEKGDMRSIPAVGQTLPNWCGEDGKGECQSRTMVFSNKLAVSYGPETMERLAQLLDSEALRYFNPKAVVRTVIDHEFAHNLGPQMNMKASDGKAVSEHLGNYTWKLEEMKAEIGAVYFNRWFSADQKWYDDTVVREGYVALASWMFGQLKKAYPKYKEGKLHEARSPYQLLSAVMLGYLTEKKAISFNETSQKFSIRFERMPAAIESLLHDVGQIYMRHNKEEVVAFYDRYTKGNGLQLLHMERIYNALGSLRETRYNFKIEGL